MSTRLHDRAREYQSSAERSRDLSSIVGGSVAPTRMRFHVLMAVRESTAIGPPSPVSIGAMRSTTPSPRYFSDESTPDVRNGTMTILFASSAGVVALFRVANTETRRAATPSISHPAPSKSVGVLSPRQQILRNFSPAWVHAARCHGRSWSLCLCRG